MEVLLVDMNTGLYLKNHIGHEKLNFVDNNGYFYGFVPPDDSVDITRLGANKNHDFVDDVLVIYVTAISKQNRNRKISAFSKNAKVFKKRQDGKVLGRVVEECNGSQIYATYSIKSNNLKIINDEDSEFVIEIKKYNSYMFRKQRSYLDKFADLKEDIIAYVESFDGDYSYQVQQVKAATQDESIRYSKTPDQIVTTSKVKQVRRNPEIGKKVIEQNGFRCLIDKNHFSFKNKDGNPYMEAHHVIPCTVSNSDRYKGRSKIDREENIVSLCPNCHKAVHLGNNSVKKEKLKSIYDKQINKLKQVGLDISFSELYKLY